MLRVFLIPLFCIGLLFSSSPSNDLKPTRVYASAKSLIYMVYVIDKDALVAINSNLTNREKRFLNLDNKPIIGGFYGDGRIPNLEAILKLNPDLVILSETARKFEKLKETFASFKIPVLYLNPVTFKDYIASLKTLGEIFDKKERVDELIKYIEESLELSKKLQEYIEKNGLKKVKVYLASDINGLSTECDASPNSEGINLAGAINVHKCDDFRKVNVSFEQILTYDPDIILVSEPKFYTQIYDSKMWSVLRAVKEKRVYQIPNSPQSFVARPPTFMWFLGLRWLIDICYKEAFELDMIEESKKFYKLFFDINLSTSDIEKIINQ